MMAFPRTKMVPLVLILPMLFAAGCSDDPTGTSSNEPPALPDQESLTLDLSAIAPAPSALGSTGSKGRPVVVIEDHRRSSGKTHPDAVVSADSASNSNYLTGRLVADVAIVAIAAFSAAPSHAFAGATHATPVEQGDGSWNWNYSVTYGSAEFDLTLNGKAQGASTDWSMTVSSSGVANPVSDFLWYSGTTSNGGATGSWQLYDMGSPEAQTNLVEVEWNRESADERIAVWRNNRTGSVYNGDELTFEQNEDEMSITYQEMGEVSSSFVRWNIDSTEGSVRLPVYNGGQEACWDSQHLNASCAQ